MHIVSCSCHAASRLANTGARGSLQASGCKASNQPLCTSSAHLPARNRHKSTITQPTGTLHSVVCARMGGLVVCACVCGGPAKVLPLTIVKCPQLF